MQIHLKAPSCIGFTIMILVIGFGYFGFGFGYMVIIA
jgi:hypothetical protein